MKHVLFICGQNRLRSPTAEQVFAHWPGIEVSSAGLKPESEERVTPELIEWAEIIFVMEKSHKTKINAQFKQYIRDQRIICLDIPDNYEYMSPALIEMLKKRVSPHLPQIR
jgi:predicted protein tyrosine phosphatase